MNPQVWAARKAAKLSQTALAAMAQIEQPDVSLIENDGWVPPLAVQERLAEALSVPVRDLFPEVRPVEPSASQDASAGRVA